MIPPFRNGLKTELARRTFMSRTGISLGSMAAMGLLQQDLPADTDPTSPGNSTGAKGSLPHFQPRVKRIHDEAQRRTEQRKNGQLLEWRQPAVIHLIDREDRQCDSEDQDE